MDLTATPRDGLLGKKDNEPAAPAVHGILPVLNDVDGGVLARLGFERPIITKRWPSAVESHSLCLAARGSETTGLA